MHVLNDACNIAFYRGHKHIKPRHLVLTFTTKFLCPFLSPRCTRGLGIPDILFANTNVGLSFQLKALSNF